MELEASAPQRHNASQILLVPFSSSPARPQTAGGREGRSDRGFVLARSCTEPDAVQHVEHERAESLVRACDETVGQDLRVEQGNVPRARAAGVPVCLFAALLTFLQIGSLEDKVEEYRQSNSGSHAGMACLAHSLLLSCNKLSLGAAASYR
eukprot:763558-Hanusia_phi.AAC.3